MLKSKTTLILILIFFSSCTERNRFTRQEQQEKIILYRQASKETDKDIDFKISEFWKGNFEDKTFITQEFDPYVYNKILDSIHTFDFINNQKPQFNNSIEYAFINYKKNKTNDTIYYDGLEKWWIIKNGNIKQYQDKNKKFKKTLQMFYPIFRNCSPE